MTQEKYGFDVIAFFNFIKFLYTDNIPWTELAEESIIGILKCSDYYDVPRLRTEAANRLLSKLDTNNAILLLETAILFRDKNLEEKSLEIIDKSARTVFQSKAMLEAKMETLFEIIKRDELDIDESQVLDVCLMWSEKECERKGLAPNKGNKRGVLDKIFYEIRFPVLPPLQFAKMVHSKFITRKESLDMLLHMRCAGDGIRGGNKNLLPEMSFKTEKRAKKVKWICSRCKHVNITSFYSCPCEICWGNRPMLKQTVIMM